MFLYKQVPAERLSGLNGNHASRGVWGSALRAKSYKSSRQNDSNPINPPNLLNHPKGICFYINKFLRND